VNRIAGTATATSRLRVLLLVGVVAVGACESAAAPAGGPLTTGEGVPTEQATAAPTAMPTAQPAAVTTAEPTAAPTAEPTAAPTAEQSAVPSADAGSSPTSPAPSLSSGPGGWRAFGEPGFHVGLGIAGNGDVIVVSTRAASANPVALVVTRFDPAGRQVSRVVTDRAYQPPAGDDIDVDPTDDSVLIPERVSGGQVLRRVRSQTGRLAATIRLPAGINDVAVDAAAVIHGAGGYLTSAGLYAFVVRLRRDGTLIASYDAWLRSPPKAPLSRASILQEPSQVALGRDGRLVIFGAPYSSPLGVDDNGPPGDAASITSLTTAIRGPRSWNVKVEWGTGSVRFSTWARHPVGMTADARGNVFLGEYIPTADGLGFLGYRLRMFGPDGGVLAAWGHSSTSEGLFMPFSPVVDAAGRLWVLDGDPELHQVVIKVLDHPPGG
jgi:hypothetical protein